MLQKYAENKDGKRFKINGTVNVGGLVFVSVVDENNENQLVGIKDFDNKEFLLDEEFAKAKFIPVVARNVRTGDEVLLEVKDALDDFIKEMEMDENAVISVLEKKSKTHRKWSFEYAE